MAPPRQLRAQRDRRERVPRVAERRDQEAPAQSISASSRIIAPLGRLNATGDTISEPTPASRYTSSRSRTLSRGPDQGDRVDQLRGTAAAASSFLPSRYRSWISLAASSKP